jgi:hypothetical protein
MQALHRPPTSVPTRRACPELHPDGNMILYSAIAGRCPLVVPRASASRVTRLLTVTKRNLRTFAGFEQRRKLQEWVQTIHHEAVHHYEQAKSRLAA